MFKNFDLQKNASLKYSTVENNFKTNPFYMGSSVEFLKNEKYHYHFYLLYRIASYY